MPAHGFDTFDTLFGDAADFTPRAPEPMLPFGIMFTSGTTSRPKAVVHTHANAIWASRTGPRNIDITTDDTYLIYLPFFHVNAQSWSMFSAFGVGATVVLMPKWSQSRFWPMVVEHGVTHISVMPFVMGALGSPDKPTDHTLRVGVFGLIMPDLDKMFGIDVYAAYGMTETVTHCITAKSSEKLPMRSMGHVTPGYEIAVVNQDTGELCAEGEMGELWMRGTRGIQLFLEYYDNDEANAKAFEDGWFKTGDMVKMGAGGNVFYQERDKDLLKVGGENVSAKEVEDLIVSHPAVQSVAIVGKQHEFLERGRGGVRDPGRRATTTTTSSPARSSRWPPTTWRRSRCRVRSTSSRSSPPAPSTRSSRTSSARWPTNTPPSTEPQTRGCVT